MYPYMDGVFAYFKPSLSALLRGRSDRIELFLLVECFLVLIIIEAGGGGMKCIAGCIVIEGWHNKKRI